MSPGSLSLPSLLCSRPRPQSLPRRLPAAACSLNPNDLLAGTRWRRVGWGKNVAGKSSWGGVRGRRGSTEPPPAAPQPLAQARPSPAHPAASPQSSPPVWPYIQDARGAVCRRVCGYMCVDVLYMEIRTQEMDADTQTCISLGVCARVRMHGGAAMYIHIRAQLHVHADYS